MGIYHVVYGASRVERKIYDRISGKLRHTKGVETTALSSLIYDIFLFPWMRDRDKSKAKEGMPLHTSLVTNISIGAPNV